ncbi:MAG TPA: AI-2E family transporter [bacterium]|nr:AI-2E family transporter [bacterium]
MTTDCAGDEKPLGDEMQSVERRTPPPIDRWLRVTMGVLIAAAAAYLLFRLRFVLLTVALATMLAYALLPFVELVARIRVASRPLPRILATLAVFVIVTAIVTGAFRIAARPVAAESSRFAQSAQLYRDRVSAFLTNTRASVRRGLPPPAQVKLDQAFDQAGTLIVNAVGRMLQAMARWLTHVVELVLIPILAFYFLVDLPSLSRELLEFLPPSWRDPVRRAGRHADRIVAGYVRGQLLLMLISGVVVSVGLAVLGEPFPLLLGIVAGLTRAIPVVGPVMGSIPIVGVTLLQSPNTAVAVLIFFIVLQIVETQIILPHVIGHELRLHAPTILLALLIGNALFGFMGMFLAPPAAAFVKSLGEIAEGAGSEPGARGADVKAARVAAARS